MAYVVSIDDGWATENYYFAYKQNALEKFNSLLNELGLKNINADKVPCNIEHGEWRIRVKQIRWSDTANNYFLFYDDEKNPIFVMWDTNTFLDEYRKLQNKYWKNDWDFVDFYDKLEQKLKWKWVVINTDMPILYHDQIKFE